MATDQAQRRRALWFEPACVASREGDGGVVEANVVGMGCTRKASPPREPQGVVNTVLRMQIQALGLVPRPVGRWERNGPLCLATLPVRTGTEVTASHDE